MKYWKSYLEVHKENLAGDCYPQELDVRMVVVVPAFNEPGLLTTLRSLTECTRPECNVLVAVIVNSGEQASEVVVQQNRNTYNEIIKFAEEHNVPNLSFYPLIVEDLPQKHAGVGLARKIGMDHAIKHFHENENRDGILVSLDADCTVDPDYLTTIYAAYVANPKLHGTVHQVIHRLETPDPVLEKSIRQYEAYLRYFREMLIQIGFPYPYQTIGSGFSVAAQSYVKVGGMGRQQGGEDFYFLQKLFQLGFVRELFEAKVYPLARYSDRVPFGTGPTLRKMQLNPDKPFEVYSRRSFNELGKLFSIVINDQDEDVEFLMQNIIERLHPALKKYLDEIGIVKILQDCKENTANPGSFSKRFYHHFNAFRIIKYLNQVHPRPFKPESIDALTSIGVVPSNLY